MKRVSLPFIFTLCCFFTFAQSEPSQTKTSYSLKLVGGCGYFFFVGEVSGSNYSKYGEWSDVFDNRKGLSGFVGLRIGF